MLALFSKQGKVSAFGCCLQGLWEPLVWSSTATSIFQSLLILVIVNPVIWVWNSWGIWLKFEYGNCRKNRFRGVSLAFCLTAPQVNKHTVIHSSFPHLPPNWALRSQPELETRDGRHVCDSLLPDKVGMGVWHGKTDTAFTCPTHWSVSSLAEGKKGSGAVLSLLFTSVLMVLILAIRGMCSLVYWGPLGRLRRFVTSYNLLSSNPDHP